jgi:hypothetical protein
MGVASERGLKQDGGDPPNIQTLRAGEIIQLASRVRESGLVEVLCNGDMYTVFERDIAERGELIDSPVVGFNSAA